MTSMEYKKVTPTIDTMAYYGSRQVCQLPERMIIIVLLLLPARHRSPRIVLSNIEMVQMRTYIHM